jgi:hypothetical protein
MPRRFELRRVNPQRQIQRPDRSYPRDCGQPPADWISLVLLHQRGVDRSPPHLDALDFLAQQCDGLLRRRRHCCVIGRGDLGPQLGQSLLAERRHDSDLGGMAAQRIDQLGALPHQ